MVMCTSPLIYNIRNKIFRRRYAQNSESYTMGTDRPSILCPWLKLARQCRTVPSLIYPASQQVLLVWAQCCYMACERELARVRPAWSTVWLSSCLTELSVYMCPFSPLLMPKLNFHCKTKKWLCLELQDYKRVDNRYHNIVCKWNGMHQLFLQNFQQGRYDIWD